MRNSDYLPSRLDSQRDGIQLLYNVKRQANIENTVGLLSMAGKNPQVLVTLTAENGKLASALHQISLGGTMKLSDSLQIAQVSYF